MSFLPTRRSALACVLALAGGIAAASPAAADIIRKEDMLRGIAMTRAQCTAIADTVWVTASSRDFCVRYYLSTAGGEGSRPVVFIQGDYFGKLDPKTWSFPDPSDTKDINTDDLMKMADACPGLTFDRLSWTADWHIREETYSKALAEIINVHHKLPFARHWGDGSTSSSDGQAFPISTRRPVTATINAKYGRDPTVTFYTHVSCGSIFSHSPRLHALLTRL